MARTKKSDTQRTDMAEAQASDALLLRQDGEPAPEVEAQFHVIAPGVICATERRGRPTPEGRDPFELVINASEGFVPLWAPNTTLRWRFQERSMLNFVDPQAARLRLRRLFGEAILKWDNAAPIKFSEDEDVWDFEIVMSRTDSCLSDGRCTLARAFFPDSGRHELLFYPKLFTQSYKEQVDTLVHEVGHMFGLRHFFAQISETAWPSEIFGTHDKFTIMNYGALSELSDADKADLKSLYLAAWSGALPNINGTPVRFVQPYHTVNEAESSPGAGALALAAFGAPARPA